MKTNKLMLWAMALLMAFGMTALASGGKNDKEVKIKTSAQCDMCKSRIEKNLTLTKGVKEAVLDVETKVVTIKYNGKKTNEAALKKVITDTGYDADDMVCSKAAHDKLPNCCQKSADEHSHH